MTDGIATALAGLIGAATVVLLMAGTKYFGAGSNRRESRDEQDDDYRRFRDWMRRHPREEDEDM